MLDGRRFDKVAEGRAGIGLDNGLPHGLPIVGAISFTDFVDHQFSNVFHLSNTACS